MAPAYEVRPYQLQRFTEPIPADDNKCFICLREFGQADDDEDNACDALRPNCGHYIGSVCFLKLLRRGRPMVCSLCQAPYPLAKPTFPRRLASVLQRLMFTAEIWLFSQINELIGRHPYERIIKRLSDKLIQGKLDIDWNMADIIFTIGRFPIPSTILLILPVRFAFFVATDLLGLSAGSYLEVRLFPPFVCSSTAFEGLAESWLCAFACSTAMALLAWYIPSWWEKLTRNNPGSESLRFVATNFAARAADLILCQSWYGRNILVGIHFVIMVHYLLHCILISHAFYES